MYLIFGKIALITYFFIFILRSLSHHIFTNFLFKRLTRYINNICHERILNNSKDEWILVRTSNQYIERDKDNIRGHYVNKIPDYDLLDDIEDMEENNIDIFKKIIRMVWRDNSSSMAIILQSIALIMCIKLFASKGHILEILFSIFAGSLIHFIYILFNFTRYIKSYYFDKTSNMVIEDINLINRFNIKLISVMPIFIILLVNMLKANMYHRIIGEWIVDLSNIYLYFGVMIGIYGIENIMRIINYSRRSINVFIVVGLYSILAFLL